MSTQVVVPLRPGSDGDPTHRPGSSYTEVDPPTVYLEKLATAWMKARGESKPGVSYVLDRLPAGYACFQKSRANGQNLGRADKWLYGHPKGRTFDSPNRFYPHFEYLMDNNGNSIGCPCSVCVKGGVFPSSRQISSSGSTKSTAPKSLPCLPGSRDMSKRQVTSSRSTTIAVPRFTLTQSTQHKGRPKTVLAGMDTSRVDEEGTPDVYRNLFDKLKRHGSIDEAIMEPMSLDWRSEQTILPDLLENVEKQPQWIPRVGDIVLYMRGIPEGRDLELLPNDKTFRATPIWEAGLVGQAPEEPLDADGKEANVSISGVRVEPLPNPNDRNKSLSKRSRYIPVSNTRPFFLWQEFLLHTKHGEDAEDTWHPTIRNALTVMSTFAFMGKHRFRGEWPEAQIYSHGIYIGSEFIAVGDTVRLSPKPDEDRCTTILVISSIRIFFKNLDKASRNDYDEGPPYNSLVRIYGSGYTTDASKSNKEWRAKTPKSAEGYAEWYPLHPENKEMAVPLSRVLGRLYEHEALCFWLSLPSANLDVGREGVLDARQFAVENDNRIIETPGTSWFHGESRAEALDLQTINGLEISKYDGERYVSKWRQKIKRMEGLGGLDAPDALAAKRNRSLRNHVEPGGLTGGCGSSANKRTVDVSSGEDDDEECDIKKSTKIVDSSSQHKKAKVRVIVK